MFSTRVPGDRRTNEFSRALAAARERGAIVDLTVSNPTRVGIDYPDDLLSGLSGAGSLAYHPHPLGLPEARAAIAATYAARGLPIGSDRIVLTASTSEAYSVLFKLLCDPGGSAVLTPVPSYPLFDHLARLDGVDQHCYPLEFHGDWTIDLSALDRAWTGATRAVLAVTPNNPTGSLLHDGDADELAGRCASRGAALILDEVFADYPLEKEAIAEPMSLVTPRCLLFRLGGLSKSVGLPQVKLGWIAVDGPDELVVEALDRLELICDTYLSVATPVQVAARSLLDRGAAVRAQILARVRANYAVVRDRFAGSSAASVLRAAGGWSAVLRIPATRPEEAVVLELLEQDGVVVHPGYFFDFPHEAFLVISLLPEPGVFAGGVRLMQERLDAA